MDETENERRARAAKYHAEYRKRALDAPEITGRWMLAAAAAGALACLNGLLDSNVSEELARTLAFGVTGFVASMSFTGAGLSYRNGADTDYMIFWETLDRPIKEIPTRPTPDPLVKSAKRKQQIAGMLLPAGNLTFMLTAVWGAWQINNILGN